MTVFKLSDFNFAIDFICITCLIWMFQLIRWVMVSNLHLYKKKQLW